MTELGIVVAAALAAVAVLAPSSRGRALAMLGALALTPVLLLADIADTPQLEPLRDRPAVAAAGAAAGLAVLAALAVLFGRRPGLFAGATVAALPFRVPIESGGATANLLVPLYVVVGAGALAWLVPRLRGDGAEAPPRPNGWLERLLAAAVVLYAVQASYSSDDGKALEQVVFFYVPFLLLFGLLRELDWTPRLARRCLIVLLVLAVVFAGIGFVEYQQRELLLNPKVIASNQFEDYFRVNSLFFDPNIYGRFLALVMLGLAGVLLWSTRTRTALLAAAGLALLWAGLLLTLSQSSFAALLAGLVVLAALRWAPWRSLAAAGVAVAVAAVLVVAFPGALRLDLSSNDSIDRATSGRFDLMRGGVELARDRPVLGFGSGSFSREYRRAQHASSERAVSASHTIPITVAAEQGLIGLAVYLALLAAALARLLRGAGRDVARAVVGAGFVALVLHTWLYAAFLEDPVTYVLLGVGAALARDARARSRRRG
jgi:O-antigen ligase